jgi:HrpA-like RNA helicase
MISQPRRLAVVNLKNRLQEQLGSKVGMRMGHGVKEESSDTIIYFVTSGYLVQLLAHQHQAFQKVTHLIIDEVHERSVDSDLLCWLAKRLLAENPLLRLVLMSATLHTKLYQDYFSTADAYLGDLNCLSGTAYSANPIRCTTYHTILTGMHAMP